MNSKSFSFLCTCTIAFMKLCHGMLVITSKYRDFCTGKVIHWSKGKIYKNSVKPNFLESTQVGI